MKKGYAYTIVFMAAISLVVSAILAGVNAAYDKKVEENEEIARIEAILYAMGIGQGEDEIFAFFEENVKISERDGTEYYTSLRDDGVEVHAAAFEGPGLWGTIRGYIAVETGSGKLAGIAFTEQNETPGLGGRIDEQWYKEQFRGVSLSGGVSYGEGSGIDAITGATSSSNAVLKIINDFAPEILKEYGGPADE